MRVFCRHSKVADIDADEFFNTVSAGIKYYEQLFGMPFPFPKYDSIFCPEFRISAMENVGAVTWNDALIKPRDQQTAEVTSFVQFVALHELAHMWFGDLVTM